LTDADANFAAMASWRANLELLSFKAAAVVAAIGVHDAVQFLLLELLDLSLWRSIGVLFAYALPLAASALTRIETPVTATRFNSLATIYRLQCCS
jgi:hypothetical protein